MTVCLRFDDNKINKIIMHEIIIEFFLWISKLKEVYENGEGSIRNPFGLSIYFLLLCFGFPISSQQILTLKLKQKEEANKIHYRTVKEENVSSFRIKQTVKKMRTKNHLILIIWEESQDMEFLGIISFRSIFSYLTRKYGRIA